MSRTIRHKLTGAKSVDPSCRNHGTCPWCESNRRYNEIRDMIKSSYDMKHKESGCIYKVGDVVKFVFDTEEKVGVIEIADKFAFFSDYPSYDILVEEDNMLYKHVPEEDVLRIV